MNLSLTQVSLFEGMDPQEIDAILDCLSAQKRTYAKGETIFSMGQSVGEIGVVLTGSVHLLRVDYWGRQSLLHRIGALETFGEAFASLGSGLRFDVIAAEESEVLFLNVERVLTTCSAACRFHHRLIRNLLTLLAAKNLELTKKLDLLSQRSTRGKLMEYLSAQAALHGSAVFEIPFNRQQLADYLSVERTAMTTELSRMVQEGILRVDRRRFELLS